MNKRKLVIAMLVCGFTLTAGMASASAHGSKGHSDSVRPTITQSVSPIKAAPPGCVELHPKQCAYTGPAPVWKPSSTFKSYIAHLSWRTTINPNGPVDTNNIPYPQTYLPNGIPACSIDTPYWAQTDNYKIQSASDAANIADAEKNGLKSGQGDST